MTASGGGTIDFWFTPGSTYTYLTVMRLGDVARANDVRFTWRPFDLRTILLERNLGRPFVGKPVKLAYIWRDIERRAPMYGLNPVLPAPYPLQEWETAHLVATLAAAEGWIEPYTRASYRRWFEDGQQAGMEPNLSDSLHEAGQNPERVIAAARAAETKAAAGIATEQAMALGVFGSPNFVVDGELFWGDDRLDDVLRWQARGTLA